MVSTTLGLCNMKRKQEAEFDSTPDESEEDRDFSGSECEFSDLSDSEIDNEGSESEAEFTDSEEENGKKRRKNVKSSVNEAKKKAASDGGKVKKKKITSGEKEEKELPRRSRFLDMEAEVGDEEDEYEDDEDAEFLAQDGFIVGSDEEEEANAAAAELGSEIRSRRPHSEDTEFDAEAEERRLKAIYGRARDAHARSTASKLPTSQSHLPKPFLLPTVTDPKLWLCKTQQGRERSSALALLRCVMERQFSGNPLPIFSIIARDGLKGYVYIEAHKPAHVFQAIDTAKLGHCLYPGQGGKSLVLVPLAEMPQVLQTTAASSSVSDSSAAEIPEIGSWVRVKRGRYANDLAQVVDNAQDEGSFDPSNLNTCIVRVKMLPRLVFSTNSQSKTKSSATDRAPPKAFDPEEASRYGQVSKSRGFWIYGGETYHDGFLFKNLRLSSLQCDSINPTLEELARFPESTSSSDIHNDMSQSQVMSASIASSSAAAALASFSIGDRVVVLEGEMKNLPAVIDSLEWRPNPLTGRPEQVAHVIADASTGLEGESGAFFVKVSILRKTFQVGEQVRVLSGPHANESGIVVSIDPKSHNIVVFSAINSQQFTASPSICVKAEGSNDSTEQQTAKKTSSNMNTKNAKNNDEFSLDDLVQFNVNGEDGVGVIIRILDTEKSVSVFDSLGQVRNAPCRTLRLLATAPLQNSRDFQQSGGDDKSLKQNDRVSDGSGLFFKIIHIYKSLAFLRPLSAANLAGSVPCCVHPLEKLSRPRTPGVPSFASAAASGSSGFAGRGLLGKSVTITAGPQKGYVGFVKQITDNLARVELHTNGKVINVAVDKLSIPEKEAARISASSTSFRHPSARHSNPHSHSQQAQHPSESGTAYTPAWNAMPSGSKTPSWNVASGTSKTPSWNASSSKTPAWNSASNSSMTPSHAQFGTSKTPAWSATTGMTPAWNVPTAVGQSSTSANWKSGTTPAWGSSAKTPAWTQSESNNNEVSDQQKKKPWDQVNYTQRD